MVWDGVTSDFGQTQYLDRALKTVQIALSERRLIFINFDNFCQKDGREAKIMRVALIFHLI